MSKHPIALAIVLAACAALPAAASADEPPIAVSHASGGADVSDLAQTTVVLHAGVVANGHRLSCEVDYARDDLEDDDSGPYTSSVPCREALQPGAPGEQPVSAALSGLQPGSHYRFQFLIKDTDDASITRHTNESSFTMLMVAPGVVTGDAVDVRDLGATLTGTIDPHGDRTTCRFDFGPTAAYDNEVSCATFPGSGEGPVAVRADLSGLDPGATYHYRLVGAKSDQEVEGADHTFTVPAIATGTPPTTGATPPRPIVSPSPTPPGVRQDPQRHRPPQAPLHLGPLPRHAHPQGQADHPRPHQDHRPHHHRPHRRPDHHDHGPPDRGSQGGAAPPPPPHRPGHGRRDPPHLAPHLTTATLAPRLGAFSYMSLSGGRVRIDQPASSC
jgi:hypothetical protein